MRRIDEPYMEFPFADARMLARLLRRKGREVGRRRVRTLMKRMGVEALYCKPNTSRRNAQHKSWPYLLRCLKIERASQAWALDTAYIPMASGFVYLPAAVDWARRYSRIGAPSRGKPCMPLTHWRKRSPVTCCPTSGTPARAASSRLARSPGRAGPGHRATDGRQGSWRDNMFVERVGRSIKYEEV